jgi:hypothetical protein
MANKEEASEETLVVERIIKSNSGLLISYWNFDGIALTKWMF